MLSGEGHLNSSSQRAVEFIDVEPIRGEGIEDTNLIRANLLRLLVGLVFTIQAQKFEVEERKTQEEFFGSLSRNPHIALFGTTYPTCCPIYPAGAFGLGFTAPVSTRGTAGVEPAARYFSSCPANSSSISWALTSLKYSPISFRVPLKSG